MTKAKKPQKIRIVKNGPYLVEGSIPLVEKIITPKGRTYIYEEGRTLPQKESYSLCRCGKTTTPPFCDGAHVHHSFDGEETASREPYLDRADTLEGPTIDLLDDHRCALARFCHRNNGDAWQLTLASGKEENREEAIVGANECPAGRLTAREKDGTLMEPELEPQIAVLQDPEKGVSSALYVQGGVPIESYDGTVYEVRNRVTLCRCGHSSDMPFCDASHIYEDFQEGGEKDDEEA